MTCTCGHPRDTHQHYRAGQDCAGRVQRAALDGLPWSKPCRCPRYRPSLLGWLADGFRTLRLRGQR